MNTKNIYIALDNVRSLHNVGAIMRTCSFFGIKNLILIGYSGTTYDFKGNIVLHPNLKKTALGAENDLNTTLLKSPKDLLEFSRQLSLQIVSIEQDKKAIYLNTCKDFNDAIYVFGNELEGVSRDILALSEKIIEIKSIGKKESLNVSNAFSIFAFHISTQN